MKCYCYIIYFILDTVVAFIHNLWQTKFSKNSPNLAYYYMKKKPPVACHLIKKRPQNKCFPVSIAHFLRTLILINIYERLLLLLTAFFILSLKSSLCEILRITSRFVWSLMSRSSCSQTLFKIGVLKNVAAFTGKHLRRSLFLIKLQYLDLQLY